MAGLVDLEGIPSADAAPVRAGSRATGTFIAIEGIDGAGKTTTAGRVAEVLGRDGFVFRSNKHIPDDAPALVQDSMRAIAALLWPGSDRLNDHELPGDYWLCLQGAWYSLLSRFVIEPLLQAGTSVVTDGWYFKFAAKLLARGYSHGQVESVFGRLRVPDDVILLDVGPGVAWGRGRPFRLTEMGLHDGYDSLGVDSFLHYQGRLRELLNGMAGSRGWSVVQVSDEDSPERVIDLTAKRIADRGPEHHSESASSQEAPAR
jgi:thymidylate kinase